MTEGVRFLFTVNCRNQRLDAGDDDIGVGAGVHGGHVIAEGTAKQIAANPESLTGQYLSGKKKIEVPKVRHQAKTANDDKYQKCKIRQFP